ncbi:MAG: hypothetical protein NXY57DRAFT_431929 [Lentinula lateritia]|uniref:Uncharacterized protein n=1 Tax=Lentinula lateritia TaxID=40482 RepID=A0ABQ8VJM3_9AGAR|nr:hypothetical protein EV359DRAFT_39530 [Lentinula novae-zelandiae]KAJ3929274.1 MAG: hypothetical protein NXY57DRAFT_431929 [Lentinula lateritia]KAJ4494152.1 hypothetical protein C8R41DRAFT_317718 [Lentinula lateritia]
MSSPNPVVTLEPFSLYISTTQIFAQPGKFHWSFYLTDAYGIATRYHWSERGGTRGVYAEGVHVQVINPVTTYSASYNVALAYFKVTGFNPATPPNIMQQAAFSAFPESYLTVRENRQNGLSCRTWVLQVLRTLITWRYLVRNDYPESIEAVVKARSMQVENSLMTSFTGSVVVYV